MEENTPAGEVRAQSIERALRLAENNHCRALSRAATEALRIKHMARIDPAAPIVHLYYSESCAGNADPGTKVLADVTCLRCLSSVWITYPDVVR